MGDDSSRTLWLGDLPFWADENYVFNLFASTGAVVSCKIIRNKVTNLSEGYGFVEFRTHEAAEQVPPLPSPSIWRRNLRGFPAARRVSTRHLRSSALHHHSTALYRCFARASSPAVALKPLEALLTSRRFAGVEHIQWLSYTEHGPAVQAQLGCVWRRERERRWCVSAARQ